MDVSSIQAVAGALMGKRLAEDITDSLGNLISVPIDGIVRELRAGYTGVTRRGDANSAPLSPRPASSKLKVAGDDRPFHSSDGRFWWERPWRTL